MPIISSFQKLIELARIKKESILRTQMERFVHVIEIKDGYFKYRLSSDAPAGLQTNISVFLKEYTFKTWQTYVSTDPKEGELTIKQQEQKTLSDQLDDILRDPKIATILNGLSNSRFIGIISEEELKQEFSTE